LSAARPSRLLAVYVAVACGFSIAPVAVIFLESLTGADYVSFPPVGLSLKWYLEIPKRPEFVASLLTSFVVAAGASVVSTGLGATAALALVRYRFPGRAFLQGLFLSPLSVPGIVLGIALLQFYATYGIPRTGLTLALAHLVITTPYTIRLVSVSLAGFDQNLERAARSLGAGSWTTFRLVTLPLIRPGILAGAVFAFIVSFDDLAVSLFLSSPGAMTLPVRIFTYIEQIYDPLITAVSSLLILVAVVVVVLIERTVGMGRLFGAEASRSAPR
jgi:putative spermidine/putrescine transport system permease protein